MQEEADQTGWVQCEGFRGANIRKVMKQQMPKLYEDFQHNRIDKVTVNCLAL